MPFVTVRIPDDLRARLDAARGDVPRERFVRGLLDRALEAGSTAAPTVDPLVEPAGLASGPSGSRGPAGPASSATTCPSCERYDGPPRNGRPCAKCGATREAMG